MRHNECARPSGSERERAGATAAGVLVTRFEAQLSVGNLFRIDSG